MLFTGFLWRMRWITTPKMWITTGEESQECGLDKLSSQSVVIHRVVCAKAAGFKRALNKL